MNSQKRHFILNPQQNLFAFKFLPINLYVIE